VVRFGFTMPPLHPLAFSGRWDSEGILNRNLAVLMAFLGLSSCFDTLTSGKSSSPAQSNQSYDSSNMDIMASILPLTNSLPIITQPGFVSKLSKLS
jgi:hypothetical protein